MSTISLNESFGEQRLLDTFLRSTKLMKIIEEKTEEFIKKYETTKKPEDARAPIILELPFQFADFQKLSETLLHLVVEEPLEFLDTAKYLIYSVIASILKQSQEFTPKAIASEQVHVHCRFIGLPVQEDLIYKPSENKFPGGLSVITGVLSGYTEPVSYTIQSVWYCTRCQANRIKQEITKAPNCYTCSSPMNEYSELRCMRKYRLLKVFPIESVSTPRVVGKIFRSEVIHLNVCSMESNETIENELSFVKSIPDADLHSLLEFSQVKDDANDFEFQHHQPMDCPLHTTDLLHESDVTNLSIDKTRKYPEFTLSFSPGPVEASIHITTLTSDRVDLSTEATQSKHEESIYVLPQIKNEPLDLSILTSSSEKLPTEQFRSPTKNDFNLEFSAFDTSVQPSSSKSVSNPTVVDEEQPSQSGPSCSRGSPMEFLALSYSQSSLGENSTTANTRRELHSSQSFQQIDTTQIPSSVQLLYETIKKAYSDFSFVYSLAVQMCQDKVPMDCFVHFKIGLLLSIASLEDNPNRPPISIVAIGTEFDIANYLMETIGNVADRFIGAYDDFKVPAGKSDQHTWIEASPIVMARGGIYYVGDWGRLKPANAFKLLKAVECGRVALEKTTLTCPLEAAVWTHWRSFKYDTKDQHTFNKFIEIFGIPLIIEEDNHEILVDFMLQQASVQVFESAIDELSIGDDDMRQFLSIVSKRRMDLSNDASDLLRKYFVASRMDRPDCLSQQSFVTLKLFAESFAKLSLRHEVITIDAIAAIYMTENFIQNIFGEGVNPPPKFELHTYVGAVDEHMVKFQDWVHKYIEQFHDDI